MKFWKIEVAIVRELFVMAREHAPSIIFMDEIDSIGSSRVEGSSGGDSEVQRTMLELLNQLDGFEATKNIKVGFCLFTRGFFLLLWGSVYFNNYDEKGLIFL
ncbi:hypothetical protein ANCDUO_14701 [Ancylostoma duodenale]|uniref:ATPase AAA-type core domain-containing protein n=1 Tax=Ancylostoma duodenale TaxID=51022 RepID=A0A0C2CZ82_9BILA|nr:hypothetical protein ANCDUO_14701 [Ancylostoma duodenale]